MKTRLTILGCLSWLVLFPAWGWAQGADSKKAVKALSERIDALLAAKWKEAGILPAPPAPDGQFYRRVNLDLVGRIPSLTDIRDFLDDSRDRKSWAWALTEDDLFDIRWEWVDKILEKKENDIDHFARHWGAVLRSHMIQGNENIQAQGLLPSFEAYLYGKLKGNAGYDKIAHEILTANPFNNQGFNFQQNGNITGGSPSAFYFANENKAENLAGATSRIFLGVKLECAQCHAHPFAKWTREQFWEYAAFFGAINPQGRRPGVAFNQGREITIPNTNKVVKAKFLSGAEPVWRDSVDSRNVLADWVVAGDNPFFARAAVDLVWSYFFGHSLLEPINETSEEYPITYPEVLDALAKEFVAQKYDLKFLIRAIVHSQAYQRSSVGHAKAHKHDTYYYARMPVRGLSPEQLFDSIFEATRSKDERDPPHLVQFNPFNNQQMPPRIQFLQKFASIDKRTESQTSILQALFLMNGKYLLERTKVENNHNLQTLANQGTSTVRCIESLYLMALSRLPRPDEKQRMAQYVDRGGATSNRGKAFSDVFWALLNCAEFKLNH